MTLKISENFYLPDGSTYNSLITELDNEVRQEGSAALYLGTQRLQRRDSREYGSVLLQCADLALKFEERDENYKLTDPQHKLANSVLSGMIFGGFVNEKHYPDLYKVHPYAQGQIRTALLGDAEEKFDLKKGLTPKALQIGLGAMSNSQLSKLNDESKGSLNRWGNELADIGVKKGSFIFGAGLSLYSGWSAYEQLLSEQGRDTPETQYASSGIEHIDRGDATSI